MASESSELLEDAAPTGRLGRLAHFLRSDHRYVLLGTSVAAFVGMLLSSQQRSSWSFLANVYVVELVMYYVLVAWIVLSAVALVYKLTHWRTYAQEAPFCKPSARRALRIGSYVIWAIVAVLVVDRLVMGFCASFDVAIHAESRPKDNALQSALYMLWQGRQIYVTGVTTTIELAFFGTVIAFFLALLLVFLRIQKVDKPDNDFVRFLKVLGSDFAKLYSTVIRGTPMMVQAGIIYYGGFAVMRAVTDLSTTQINGIWSTFVAGLVTISINSTAYMMEVLRGGIESVDVGQTEAARSLGLSQWQAMIKVVFPQGIKYAIPGLSNELVINIKDSSVLSVIGVFDLMFATTTVSGIYFQQLQNYMVAAVFYLILTMIASKLLSMFAKRFDVKATPVMGEATASVKGGAANE